MYAIPKSKSASPLYKAQVFMQQAMKAIAAFVGPKPPVSGDALKGLTQLK